MRLLITGATGFIGQHVLQQLVAKQFEVVVLIRDSRTELVFKNLHPAVEVVHGDVANRPDNSLYERCKKPDVLLHLAWGGLPNYNSLHHIESELPAHYQFLSYMVRSGVRTVIVAGTCFEYGMQQGCLDEALSTQPSNLYGYAKDSLRKQLEFLQKNLAFNLIWPRFFYMYGAGQSSSALYSQLMLAIKNKDKVFNMSGGEQLRDFSPVTQIARHLTDLVALEQDVGVVNLCSGEPISVRRFVENLLHQANISIQLNLGHYPYASYEPMAFWGNNKKFLTLISHSSKG
jgi:nucleoside-diphosphate-sugar epimerase